MGHEALTDVLFVVRRTRNESAEIGAAAIEDMAAAKNARTAYVFEDILRDGLRFSANTQRTSLLHRCKY